MKKAFSRLFASFSLALLVLVLPFFIGGANAAPVSPSVAEPPEKSFSVPVAEEIKQQIQALVTGGETLEIEPQETFGTRILGLVLTFIDMVRNEGKDFIASFAAIPQIESWLDQQAKDPKLVDFWKQTGILLLLSLGISLLAGWLTDIIFYPLRRKIGKMHPEGIAAKLGALTGWLFISLIPVLVFIATAVFVLGQSDPAKSVRFFVMTVVYALAILRLIRLAIRFLLAPRTPHLRLFPISTPQAKYAQSWMNAFSVIMVIGYFGSDLGKFVRLPNEALNALNSIIGLVIVVMAIVVILQKRAFVSTFIRGELSSAMRGLTLWQSLRLWLARSWHILAIAYLVIGYLVTMAGSKGGFIVMQRGTVLTLLTLIVMRIAFYWISLLSPGKFFSGDTPPSGLFRPIMQAILRLVVWVLGASAIAASWGTDIAAIFYSPWGQRVLGSVFTISATIIIVSLAYEAVHAAIEKKLKPRETEGQTIEANARMRTLLPMVRNAAMVILVIIAGMVTLSELGINTAPLLAGAGVIGIALGFGSQTLVKDFLTGLFILLEDSLAIGDVVQIGENKGVVEGITLRTVRLRDQEGALHILPFSEITRIINRTKGFSYAVITLSVAYDSDLQKVIEVMRDEGEKLREDPYFRSIILEPIEVLGVENFGDSSINLTCRIKTAPGKQWEVRRAYLLRIKQRFDAEKIEIPFPTIMQIRKDK